MGNMWNSDPRGWRLSRRGFMKGATALAGTAALSSTFAGRNARAQENTLTYLSWPGHADPFIVEPFEQEHGVKVVGKEYVGGENMLALVNQSPPGTYDVILSDREYIVQLRDAGFIDKMDPADYPFDDFWPEFQNLEGHWLDGDLYSVMQSFGYLGLVHNTDHLSEADCSSYAVMWEERVKGKVGHFDWYLPTMGCLSLYNGNKDPFNIDEAAFEALRETTFSLKPQLAGFYAMADVFSSMTNGQAWVMPGIGEWISILLHKDGLPVTTTIPDEGGIQWTESVSIGTGSENQELAKKFIQYLVSPEGQWRVATKPSYNASIPNKKGWDALNQNDPESAMLLRHTFDARNVMDEYADGKIQLRKTPEQQSIDDWTEVWNEYKNI
ncbi:MAG: spermidine/putrescine ABC transporter substrate-binding protein [Rhodospirillales bacterium]|nr:spermidine/putrescine ABC transporter substrate-binding protein [Rhodospirillales bacterium]MDE0381073.1 spermidine/putrescine ABC transporter substrate-binding protein [Rhodospirillales bacterium]